MPVADLKDQILSKVHEKFSELKLQKQSPRGIM